MARYTLHEKQVTATDANFRVTGACILFQNQGDYPVWVGLIKILPADSYKIDVMPPNFIDENIPIRFESAAVPVSGSLRVVSGKLLIVSSLAPA